MTRPRSPRVRRELASCIGMALLFVPTFALGTPPARADAEQAIEASSGAVGDAADPGDVRDPNQVVPRVVGKKKTSKTRPSKTEAPQPAAGETAPPKQTTKLPQAGGAPPTAAPPQPGRAGAVPASPPPTAKKLRRPASSSAAAGPPASDPPVPTRNNPQRRRLARKTPQVGDQIRVGDATWEVVREVSSGAYGKALRVRGADGPDQILKHADADHIRNEANRWVGHARDWAAFPRGSPEYAWLESADPEIDAKQAKYKKLPDFGESVVGELMEREVALQNRVAASGSQRFVRAQLVAGNQIMMPVAGDRGFAEGVEQLAAAVRDRKIRPEDFRSTVRQITRDLVEVLEQLEAAQITHRDLHPGNVRIDAQGRVTVLDFGAALDRSAGETPFDGVARGIATPSGRYVKDALSPSDRNAVAKLLEDFLIGDVPFDQRGDPKLALTRKQELRKALGPEFEGLVEQLENGEVDTRQLREHAFLKPEDGDGADAVAQTLSSAKQAFEDKRIRELVPDYMRPTSQGPELGAYHFPDLPE